MGIWTRLYLLVLAIIGIGLVIAGGWLVGLGGSAYYLIIGIAYLCAVWLMWQRQILGGYIVLWVALLTVPWAWWEVGAAFWDLFARLMVPLGLAGLALLVIPSISYVRRRSRYYTGAGVVALGVIIGLGLMFTPHGVIQPSATITDYVQARGDNTPANWTAYGRTTKGLRYSPFDQINRDNIAQLELAWTYRSGRDTRGADQNTPLQIGDTLYTCTTFNVVSALDVDTGKERWKFDPKASSPIWQRCRGVSYFELPSAEQQPGQPCNQRIILTTIDARLIALDAKTGQYCPAFGEQGTVQLSQHMGLIQAPFYYYQTSAPLVARDKIVVGGWVVDNQEVNEPSGVIRAFNAVTGELDWAWDLGNPAITRYPPEGESYTRETPNMWTTAAFDDELGLVYAPLGNTTPDYYGVHRPAFSDEYNAALVALDINTGRERWKFRTVNHDIWDYDLPSQPALIDIPDGAGGKVKAVLQTTKRGQLFLLNRETGKPLAEVIEKPVPSEGAVPEELPRLSKTQPYSVGMPTIGAEHLTEAKMWGMTLFDQLACRISFRQKHYLGDFTPISLKPTISQPGNLGGFNWGSLSVDIPNNRVFMNDIRVPSVFYLVPRDDYAAVAEQLQADDSGHGPSPQRGTPYGMVTEMWVSPLGVPCVHPPYGTITAIDLNTRQIAWQVPAGTAEELGPWGIKSRLPIPIGMPTYAGTSATAGGLVFFAGSQDYYLRAYDAENGKELWKYRLPIGASATPMTYVSPVTGKQYVVVSVGGAAHSPDVGDYVMAFALKDRQ